MPVCCCTRSASDTKVGDTDPKSKIEIGLRLQHHLDIGGIAAPGQAAVLGQVAAAGRMYSRSFGRGALGQPIIFSGAST